MKYQLLSEPGSQAKLDKGVKQGYLTAGLHLSPHTLHRRKDVPSLCPGSTPDCRATCLYTAGRAAIWTSVNKARMRRTRLYLDDIQTFRTDLYLDLLKLADSAEKQGMKAAVRLNATSDIPLTIDEMEPGNRLDPFLSEAMRRATYESHIFYDYTKVWVRMDKWLTYRPTGRHLTWSYHRGSELDPHGVRRAVEVLKRGGTVAMVFDDWRSKKDPPPKFWGGFPVISGENDDLRFLDPPGHVIALRPKGKLKTLTARRATDFTWRV